MFEGLPAPLEALAPYLSFTLLLAGNTAFGMYIYRAYRDFRDESRSVVDTQ